MCNPSAQAESLRYKLIGGLAVRRACYRVLRLLMESGAKGCKVVVSGKLRGQRATSMKVVSTLSGCLVAASPELVVSCSYDGSDQLWDRRTGGSPSLQCQHGAPVEACLVTPSGGLLLTAGGTMVKVWDLVAGGRLLATLLPHQ
jgi:WD40 repeat protein